MAPVACMTDFPMPRTDAAYPYTIRRQRNRFAIRFVEKYRTDEIGQMSMARGRVDSPHSATPSPYQISVSDTSGNTYYSNDKLAKSYSADISMEQEQQWIMLKRRADLLNIIARTLDLVRRNHILEKKVEALKLQTRSFVKSINNNHERTSKNLRKSESLFISDTKLEDSPLSTTDEEKTSWSRSIVKKEHVEESRKQICHDKNDRDSTRSSLERESRSPDAMMVH